MAGQWAAGRNADEAIILNPDGTVSETNTGNILMVRGDDVIRPASPAVLPGVMEKTICHRLSQDGVSVATQPLTVDDLRRADGVYVTNALMGVVPVAALDGTPIQPVDTVLSRIGG
jgi:para-aminobenzoate synthetase component 1